MRLAIFIIGVGLGTAALHGSALAEDPKQAAKVLKDQGAEAMQAGRYAEAFSLFERAYATYPSAKLKFNIGLVALKLGKRAESRAAFEEFVRNANDAPEEARQQAYTHIEQTRPYLGEIELEGLPTGTEVWVDGRTAVLIVGPTGLRSFYADAGVRTLKLAHGETSSEFLFAVAAGQRTTLDVTRLPNAPAQRSTADGNGQTVVVAQTQAPRPVYKRAWFWTTVGAATVVAATALGLGLGLGLGQCEPTGFGSCRQ